MAASNVAAVTGRGEGAPAAEPAAGIVVGGKVRASAVAVAAATGTAGAAPAAASEAPEVVNEPDRLLGLLSTTSELGRRVLDALQTDGYVVLPDVLSPSECDAELERLWSFVTTVAPSVRRDEPRSWYPSEPGDADPWPHSGWRSFSDMFQTHHAGWLFSELREKLAERVFEPVFGTHELHTSKEGFTFHRPTEGGRHPGVSKTHFVCGRPQRAAVGEHFDQGANALGLQHISSVTAFVDQEVDDGCFLCWPGSHAHHSALVSGTWRGRSDWVPLTDEELRTLVDAGCAPRRVPVKRGSVILWRSDLAHCGAPPRGDRKAFRAVAYVSMLPASLTPPSEAAKKLVAYRACHTGDHMADREHWHAGKDTGKDAPAPAEGGEARRPGKRFPYFVNGPPTLTTRQAELYGLVPYGSAQGGASLDVQVA